jgi:glutamine synthetase adenylyltransferase
VEFAPQLRSTRKRLEEAAGAANFKAGPGGLYDLDYLLGLLETRTGMLPAGFQISERLRALTGCGALTQEQCSGLLRSAELFRRMDHAIRIVEGRSRRWLPPGDAVLAQVEQLCGVAHSEQQLRAEMVTVRAFFDSTFRD